MDPERRGHRRRHLRRIPERGQLRQPYPVGEPAGHPPGHLAGQPRLPGTAGPGQCHQPVFGQLGGDLVSGLGPADESG